jgi:hypothetical protein
MDQGHVLLVNLSNGRLGEDASSLLGSLLVSSPQIAALARAERDEQSRRDWHLYIDEFQNFSTAAFATILSEARKYRLSLTIANQYLAQVDEATLAAVFGNVDTLVVFQVGAQDVETLTGQLGGGVQPQDLLDLPRYRACVRFLIDGMPSRPFTMQALPPLPPLGDPARAAIIRRTSRQRYGCPVAVVQQRVHEALGA